jgi:hypothetical protein
MAVVVSTRRQPAFEQLQLMDLNDDLLIEIAAHVHHRSLFNLMLVSKRMRGIVNLPLVWKLRCIQHFVMTSFLQIPTPLRDWKAEYIDQYLGKW